MRSILQLLCGLLSVLGLSACEVFRIEDIKPGVSTAYEVRDRLGAPGAEWPNEDGTLTWEYSQQPEGITCYMITIGQDQIVKAVEQVITETNMGRIQPGWSRDQVRRLLGRHRSVQIFDLKQEEVWDWNIPREYNDETFFNVHFDRQGRVLRTSRSTKPRP